MKFDPLFKSEKNRLFRIADNTKINTENVRFTDLSEILKNQVDAFSAAVNAGNERLSGIYVSWNLISMSDGNCNEELLAAFREYLKSLEDAGCFSFIIPSADGQSLNADAADSFIKAMVHTARRIKDCMSVIGFALPPELIANDTGAGFDGNSWCSWFVNEMSVKHSHYLYFADFGEIHNNELNAEIAKTSVILYKT